ncbi:MAG: flexitail domain-containing putative surface protein [Dehalococcoidia bacterium]
MVLRLAVLVIGTVSLVAFASDSLRAVRPASAGPGDPVLVGAGDISTCANNNDETTAALLDSIPGAVYTLGDHAYNNGTATEFANCYDLTWGRHRARTRPAAGNHDYNTSNATPYYDYFNGTGNFTGPAGDRDKGYYSYDLGDWHIIVINSNCSAIGGCQAGSTQEQWLRADLAANATTCTLAYWHHPRFSSSAVHGNHAFMQPVWQALYDYGADVVLSGHDHNYERFAPQDPTGAADPTRGIREFVVGTGGYSHYAFAAPQPNSELRDAVTYGVLKLTLHATSYDWEFVPEPGELFTDTGSDGCVDQSDDDLDGCFAAVELGTNPALGGLRDPSSFWDFMDVWAGEPPSRDRNVSISDVGAIVGRFGKMHATPPTKPEALAEALTPPTDLTGYHADFDRNGASGPNPSDVLPPDGVISIGDVGLAVTQFGHTCAGPP